MSDKSRRENSGFSPKRTSSTHHPCKHIDMLHSKIERRAGHKRWIRYFPNILFLCGSRSTCSRIWVVSPAGLVPFRNRLHRIAHMNHGQGHPRDHPFDYSKLSLSALDMTRNKVLTRLRTTHIVPIISRRMCCAVLRPRNAP